MNYKNMEKHDSKTAACSQKEGQSICIFFQKSGIFKSHRNIWTSLKGPQATVISNYQLELTTDHFHSYFQKCIFQVHFSVLMTPC